MKNEDQILLEQVYQEGIWDTTKARMAQGAGAVSGLKDRVAGGVKAKAGAALQKGVTAAGKMAGVDPDAIAQSGAAQKGAQMAASGQQQAAVGSSAPEIAKYKTYVSNSTNTIIKDLGRLGMAIGDEEGFRNEYQALLSKHLQNVNSRGALKTTAGERHVTRGHGTRPGARV